MLACGVGARTLLRQTRRAESARFVLRRSPHPLPRLGAVPPLLRRKHLRLARETLYENHTTLVDGYLGMSNDEERSEMRYVVRIAEFSESSNL